MTRAAVALLLLACALACGKYGPPVRAGQARAERPVPRLEVPLPASEPRDVEPPGQPEVEPEPPPEGAP